MISTQERQEWVKQEEDGMQAKEKGEGGERGLHALNSPLLVQWKLGPFYGTVEDR